MVDKEDLYVSIDRGVYRIGKAGVLISQASSLNTLKRLYNLKVLSRQKTDLKKMLLKLLVSVEADIKKIQNNMPTTGLPRSVSREIETPKVVTKASSSKRNSIDEELRLIQEKLAALNS